MYFSRNSHWLNLCSYKGLSVPIVRCVHCALHIDGAAALIPSRMVFPSTRYLFVARILLVGPHCCLQSSATANQTAEADQIKQALDDLCNFSHCIWQICPSASV